MNIFTTASFRSKATALLFVIGSLVSIATVNAQGVILNFAGGSGNPLTITFSVPITYTVGIQPNVGATSNSPVFVFENVGNLFGSANTVSITSAPTYSRSGLGTGTFTLTDLGSGGTGAAGINNLVATDMWAQGLDMTGANMGITDTFTLSAGTITTATYSGLMPTSGIAYTTFIADHNGLNLGAGSAVPEPSTYAAIAGAAMLGFAFWRRRRSTSVATLAVDAAA